MEHRLRAAAIVLDGDRLLLVGHRFPQTGEVWWIPPGGRVDDGESILQCAARETLEETGLSVVPDRIIYTREVVEPLYHHCAFYVLCSSYSGTLTPERIDGHVNEVRFVSQAEIEEMPVSPPTLKSVFWQELRSGFPDTRYLGQRRARGIWDMGRADAE